MSVHRLLRTATNILFLVKLLPVSSSWATTWVVEANGTGDFPTLQEAIDAAESGDTILVGPGEYEGPFWIETKNLILRSIVGPTATTLANPPTPTSAMEPVVHFFFETGQGSEIEGFTIRNGESGIRCSSASPTIRGNVIRDNTGPIGGGISIFFESAPTIEGNWILQNAAVYNCCIPSRGGGIYADDTSPVTIRRNVVAFNRCVDQCVGGGISAYLGTIEENTIFGNRSDGPAGGLELPGEGAVVSRNIVVGNRSREFADGVMVQRTTLLTCNDVWNNGAEDYWGTDPGEGDFSADPRFCRLPDAAQSTLASDVDDPFGLHDDSPCLPGQHPDGADCGVVGARGAGCRDAPGRDDHAFMFGSPRLRVFPNPTHGGVTIRAERRNRSPARLEIVDAGGRIVRRLDADATHWNGKTDAGRPVPAGLYFARIIDPGASPQSATVLVLR